MDIYVYGVLSLAALGFLVLLRRCFRAASRVPLPKYQTMKDCRETGRKLGADGPTIDAICSTTERYNEQLDTDYLAQKKAARAGWVLWLCGLVCIALIALAYATHDQWISLLPA